MLHAERFVPILVNVLKPHPLFSYISKRPENGINIVVELLGLDTSFQVCAIKGGLEGRRQRAVKGFGTAQRVGQSGGQRRFVGAITLKAWQLGLRVSR